MMRLLLDPAVAEPKAAAPVVAAPPAPAPAAAAPPAPAPAPAPKADPAPAEPAAPAWAAPKPVAAADPAKPADPAAPAPAMKEPEKFDLKLPEGVKVEPAVLEGYKALSKDLGLTSTQTQALLDRDLAAQKASQEAVSRQIKSQDAAWLSELRGQRGEKFPEFEATVSRAFDYGDPDGSFRKSLSEAGLLNNPRLMGFVERFGNLFKEDKIPSGATAVPKGKDTRPLQERLKDEFSKMNKGQK